MPDAPAPAPPPNPLHDLHAARNAEFQPYADLEIVATFGEPQAEYAAVRKAAGLMDLPQRGVLQLTGKDRQPFLNNLLTNQTWDKQARAGLRPGTGVYAFYLNVKGRIVAEMNVLELGDRILLETDVRLVPTLRAALDRYLFAEQVTLESQVGALHRLALHGPESAGVIADAAGSGDGPTGAALSDLPPLGSVTVRLAGADVTVFRDDHCSVPGFHLVVPTGRAADVWNDLLTRFGNPLELGRRRLRPIGWAAYNACRIEGGRPLFDVDFGNSADPEQSTLPAETGPLFARAVSLTKGCYLGQEIVARMHARGQLARKVVGLRMSANALPIAGAAVSDEQDNQVGMVTSSTVSPVLSNACLALAVVRKPFFETGKTVRVPAEGAVHTATVVELPFVG